MGDASGAYQDAKHNPEDPPSWAHLRGAGYRVLYPDPDEQRNPDVVARFARANHLLRHVPHQGIERRVYCLAEAVRAIEAAQTAHAQRRDAEAPQQARARLGLLGLLAWRRWGRADAVQTELTNLYQAVPLPDRARQLARDW